MDSFDYQCYVVAGCLVDELFHETVGDALDRVSPAAGGAFSEAAQTVIEGFAGPFNEAVGVQHE